MYFVIAFVFSPLLFSGRYWLLFPFPDFALSQRKINSGLFLSCRPLKEALSVDLIAWFFLPPEKSCWRSPILSYLFSLDRPRLFEESAEMSDVQESLALL